MSPFDGKSIPSDVILVEALQRPQDEINPIQVRMHPERSAMYENDGIISGKFAATTDTIILFPENQSHIDAVRKRLQDAIHQFQGAGIFTAARGFGIVVNYGSDTCREALGKDTPVCPKAAQEIRKAVEAKVHAQFLIN